MSFNWFWQRRSEMRFDYCNCIGGTESWSQLRHRNVVLIEIALEYEKCSCSRICIKNASRLFIVRQLGCRNTIAAKHATDFARRPQDSFRILTSDELQITNAS